MGSYNRYRNALVNIDGGQSADVIDKFGKTTNADSGVNTDLWDGANTTDDVAVHVAPTQARIHALVSSDADDTAGVSTLTLTANITNGDTMTIGTKVYTFQTTLTNVDGNILISAVNASGSIDNAIAAINLGGTAGTDYALAMTAPTESVTAYVGAGDTMIVSDDGAAIIATTETFTGASNLFSVAATVPGAGARIVRVSGLKTWALSETSEDVPLQGTVAVNTLNSYVFINRMQVIKWGGGTGQNQGVITATAATDTTVSSQINALNGQTQQAIMAISSLDTFWLHDLYYGAIKSASTTTMEVDIMGNSNPSEELTNFAVKNAMGLSITGTSEHEASFVPAREFVGPYIIKLRVNTNAANVTATGGFDGILTLT